MESISECTLKDLPNDIWHEHQSGKIVGDEENNNLPLLLHYGEASVVKEVNCFPRRHKNFRFNGRVIYHSKVLSEYIPK